MSRARAASIVLVAALIGVAVAWWFARDAQRGRDAAPGVRRTAAAVEVPAQEPSSPSDEAPTRAVVDAAPAAQSPPESARAPGVATLELHGTLQLFDERGRELPPRDATFDLFRWRDDTGMGFDVQVHAGLWSATIEDASTLEALSVGGLLVGERNAAIDSPRGKLPVSGEQPIDIRAHLPPVVVLRVVDGASEGDLAGVKLLLPNPSGDDTRHPGRYSPERVIASAARSPLDLGALLPGGEQRGRKTLTVGAEGFAWRQIAVDFERGGETVVRLERGARLDVLVSGVDPAVDVRLRLRRPESADETGLEPGPGETVLVFSEELERDGEVSIEGLAPGACSVRAEVGLSYGAPVVLAQADVELVAGRTAHAELVLQSAPRAEVATAAGRVYIASAWQTRVATVQLDLLETCLAGFEQRTRVTASRAESDRAGYDLFLWTCPHLQVGRYELGNYHPAFSIAVDVPKGGRSDLELVVPPPVELCVSVVEDPGGAEIPTLGLLWNPRRPAVDNGYSLQNAKYDSTRHAYVIRAPACVIDFSLSSSWDYLPYRDRVDLAAGVTALTVRLKRACGASIALMDGDTRVPHPMTWRITVETVKGPGKFVCQGYGTDTSRFMVTEPGTYSIVLPRVEGYLQPPPQTIEVFAGRYTEHVLALEPERR